MTRLKVAVVGCGHLGTIHARLLAARDDVDLVAVVDPAADAARRVAGEHGCAACWTSWAASTRRSWRHPLVCTPGWRCPCSRRASTCSSRSRSPRPWRTPGRS
ncbi:MAG: hypothetical protein EBZ74_03935 [Planctomycetia bacterium]|nr:hypothetical protein [Planctomycetia bacterium]